MNRIRFALGLVMLAVLAWAGSPVPACTTAVFSGGASADGAPLLWKNRDTDFLSNKVLYVDAQPYSYVALVNHEDTCGRWVWGGLNEAGFGIMNSVGYNLPKHADELKDLEGMIMADALRTCRTVDDFERFLQRSLGPSLGSLANFGVLDSEGRAVLFELHNRGFQKYDAAATPEKYLVNTNFSRSGTPGKGAGYLRFERAAALLGGAAPSRFSPDFLLSTMAKDFGHVLLRHPSRAALQSLPAGEPCWIETSDTIDRSYTSAALVVQGRAPGSARPATLWVIMGEPVCSVVLPFWVEARTTPAEVREGADAALYLEAKRLQQMIRPSPESDRIEYLDLSRLDNRSGTGFLPRLEQVQAEILVETAEFLKVSRTPAELAEFQEKMARKALAVMRSIQ